MKLAVIVLGAVLFSSFAGAETLMPVIDEWKRAVESNSEIREKVGSEFEVVGSGYIEDKGLLMLRAENRYYFATIDVNDSKIIEVKERPIGWKTWGDIMREPRT